MADNPISLSKYVRSLRGISRPFLAEGSDGHLYVVKAENGECTSNLLFNEAAGSVLYKALGLNCPAWKPLLVTESFVAEAVEADRERFGERTLRPGLAFGSEFLGESGRQILEILPGKELVHIRNRESLWRSWLVDICAMHSDNRQVVFIREDEDRLIATFIDHGHMFSGPEGNQAPHFVACRYLDSRIYPDVSIESMNVLVSGIASMKIEAIWSDMASMPEDWKSPSGMSAFVDCLNRLQDAKLLQGMVDMAMHAVEGDKRQDRIEHLTRDPSAAEILHPVLSRDAARTELSDPCNPHCARFVR